MTQMMGEGLQGYLFVGDESAWGGGEGLVEDYQAYLAGRVDQWRQDGAFCCLHDFYYLRALGYLHQRYPKFI